jgi:hypothetical protein
MTSAAPVGTGAGTGEVRRVRNDALPRSGPGSLDPLLKRIGDARQVPLS